MMELIRKARTTVQTLWRGLTFVGWRPALLTVLYYLRLRYYALRYPLPKRSHMHTIGHLQNWRQQDNAVLLQCTHGVVRIEMITPAIVRLRMTASDELPPYFSYATCLSPVAVPFRIIEDDDTLQVHTDALQVHIRRHPLAFKFCDDRGQDVSGWVQDIGWERGVGRWRQALPAGMHLYGMGERAFPLNLRGRQLTLTTRDPEVYEPGDDPLYINVPFVMGLHEGVAFGMLFDSMADGRMDLGAQQPDILHYETQNNELRLDYMAGPEPADVLQRYTALTGRMNLPPLWVLGYHQSRWSYESADEIREIATQFRKRRIPCEAIHFDIDYMDCFRCFTWDRQAFPDPPALLAELHEQGFKAVSMVDPGIKVDPQYHVCAEGVAQDMFCKLPDGTLFHGPVWPGECYFPDFTSPRVRRWWGGLYEGLLADGFDGFWNDMNEPTVFSGSTFPAAVQHELEGHGARHDQVHSAYGMQMLRATYEGLNQLRPHERNWVFSRSGYAGIQRYGSSWTGDNISDWDHLRLTPAMLMNLGLSGLSFTGADIGGFGGNAEAELFARWISMGAFTPFFRTHTAKHTARQEPWSFGPQAEEVARIYISWRYRLLPYIYTAFWQCSRDGTPIMRPLLYDAPDQAQLWDVDDEWLLGDHLLVAPVLTPQTDVRTVHLPPGAWYDFWNDERHSGPGIIPAFAPLDVVPLYVRAGAVLPIAPPRASTATPAQPYTLHAWAGECDSWLYEDDGISMDYRQGEYRLTHFSTRWSAPDRWHIHRTEQGAYQPSVHAATLVVHGLDAAQAWVDGRPVTCDDGRIPLPASWRDVEIQVPNKI